MSPFDRGRREGGGFARALVRRVVIDLAMGGRQCQMLSASSNPSLGCQAASEQRAFSKRNIGSYISPPVPLSRGRLGFRERMHIDIDNNPRKEMAKWSMKKYLAKEIF